MNTKEPIYKKISILIIVFLCINSLQARNERDTMGIGRSISFSENLGQWESRVLFRSQMRGTTLFVERDCFTLVVQHPDNENLHHPAIHNSKFKNQNYRTHAYRIRFEGCSTGTVEGTDKDAGHENYFIGNDPSRWRSGVGTYRSLLYHDLYDGVDMKVYSATNAMKYDFIVHPGADPSEIRIGYEGIDGIKIQRGNLIVQTSVLDIVELKPYAYQIVDGKEAEVRAEYVLDGQQRMENGERKYLVTFRLGEYDTTQALIIDPQLHLSTYTGSTADNWGTTGCYDSYKNTYTSGLVFGSGYPVSTGAYDGSYNGNADIGIFKFDQTGSQRLYATYLGGSQADMPHSMFVNSLDELIIFGTTGSNNFPVTTGAYDISFNGGTPLQYEGSSTINFPNGVDLFVCRFSSDGSQLRASTYVGGSGNDGLNYRNSFNSNVIMIGNDSLYFNYGDGARGEIITDDLNNVYVGSTTFSSDFPVTPGCVQPVSGGRQEGVVFKIDYNLSHLIWSTYLGGVKDDAVYSIDCDQDYNVVVTGGTNSSNFPVTPGAYKTSYGGGSADGFVAKISYYGKTLMASSYFGSTTYDQSYFVRCGKQGDAFLFGQTKAAGSTLVRNAGYNTPNSGQFLARLRPGLDTLVWSTVFGDGSGQPNISPTAFAVDICNRIYLSGWGRVFLGFTWNGVNYPWFSGGTTGLSVTPGAYQTSTDGQDFYLVGQLLQRQRPRRRRHLSLRPPRHPLPVGMCQLQRERQLPRHHGSLRPAQQQQQLQQRHLPLQPHRRLPRGGIQLFERLRLHADNHHVPQHGTRRQLPLGLRRRADLDRCEPRPQLCRRRLLHRPTRGLHDRRVPLFRHHREGHHHPQRHHTASTRHPQHLSRNANPDRCAPRSGLHLPLDSRHRERQQHRQSHDRPARLLHPSDPMG